VERWTLTDQSRTMREVPCETVRESRKERCSAAMMRSLSWDQADQHGSLAGGKPLRRDHVPGTASPPIGVGFRRAVSSGDEEQPGALWPDDPSCNQRANSPVRRHISDGRRMPRCAAVSLVRVGGRAMQHHSGCRACLRHRLHLSLLHSAARWQLRQLIRSLAP